MFLRQNHYRLIVHPKNAEDFCVQIVDPKEPNVTFSEIVDWIDDHIVIDPNFFLICMIPMKSTDIKRWEGLHI